MKRVVLESPYRAASMFGRWRNRRFARACLRDCLLRGEAPIASHLLHTQRGVLRDDVPDERRLGIDAGHAWIEVADAMVVYVDRGVSAGMHAGILLARKHAIPIEYRRLSEAVR